MFAEQTRKRNRGLISTAFTLHQSGTILPDSYLIDVDAFCANGRKILEEARKHNFRMYFMLKQVGRNPFLAQKLTEMGYSGAVTVDFKEALTMMEHRIPIGNVGHLVQVPQALIEKVVAYGPEVMTVYSMEKVYAIDRAARKVGKKQGILLRVFQEGDMIYSGQTAGFTLEEMEEAVSCIRKNCLHVEIRGVTSFPCYLYSEKEEDIVPTENLRTLLKGNALLEQAGFRDLIVNTPSATCVRTIRKMAKMGGNCGEPGHGLTGTTPLHAACAEEPEIPAIVYVSEVSHNFQGKAYCYGGGHYRRSHVKQALVGRSEETGRILSVLPPSDESIDYHFGLSRTCEVGETVVMAFRSQIFVTRSDVVLVEGISSGTPQIIGIYDSQGRKKG